MTSNTLFCCSCLISISNPGKSILSGYSIYNLYKRSSKKTCGNIISYYQCSSIFFKVKSSSELYLIFIYFPLQLSELLVFDLIRSIFLAHSSSYFSNMSLLSSVETSVKHLCPLLSLMYLFNLSVIRYKQFTLLMFMYPRF